MQLGSLRIVVLAAPTGHLAGPEIAHPSGPYKIAHPLDVPHELGARSAVHFCECADRFCRIFQCARRVGLGT